jgi:putative endonuclease
MTYVYLLQSLRYPNQRYVGLTGDVDSRLSEHNAGRSSHTAKYLPWELVVSICFHNERRAMEFERYLKSGSGRASAQRHFHSLPEGGLVE